jgi:energy-coupling factor transporter ATP-binding protein EcfA2
MADIQAKPIRWLWPGRIARGKVTLIAGHPGLGKSQASLSLAAIVSVGGLWPVDRTRCEQGSVIILSAEDDAADTIRPRLEASGADLSRIHIIDAVSDGFNASGTEIHRAFNLSSDLTRLAYLFERIGDVALMIVDPASAYLGKVDSHSNAEVRALLGPVADLAAKFGVAVVAISHLSKAASNEALLRVQGSIAFSAAARGVWGVARDKESPSRRLFLPLKNNLGKDETGLAFTVESHTLPGGIETSRVMWESGPVTVSAEEAFAPDQDQEERSAVAEAADWLKEVLLEGDIEQKEVRRLSDAQGFAWRTVQRARDPAGVSTRREGFGKGARYIWSMCAKNSMRASPESVAHMENLARMEDGNPPKVPADASKVVDDRSNGSDLEAEV